MAEQEDAAAPIVEAKTDPIHDAVESFDNKAIAGLAEGNELKLYKGLKWTIWENIEYVEKKQTKNVDQHEWEKLMRKVAWFDNMITFHQAWSKIPHSQVVDLLYDDTHKTFKQFEDHEGNIYQLTAINMFRYGVKPQWEDEVNAKGSEFKVDLGQLRDDDLIQKIWEKVIFDIVTGNLPKVEEAIIGARLVQKAKNQSFNSFRLELWLSGDQEKSADNDEVKGYLEKQIIGDFLRETVANNSSVKWSSHK